MSFKRNVGRLTLGTLVFFFVLFSIVSTIVSFWESSQFFLQFIPPEYRAVGSQAITTVYSVLPEIVQQHLTEALIVTVGGGLLLLIGLLKKKSVYIKQSIIDFLVDISDSDVVVEGRVLVEEFMWRLQYDDAGNTRVMHRECPHCGKEVVERPVANHLVFETGSTFNADGVEARESRDESEGENWFNVTAENKIQDRGETLALTCPDCNFAEAGSKTVFENKDKAVSEFKSHIDAMKNANNGRDSFPVYKEELRSNGFVTPSPSDLWDLYASKTSNDSVQLVSGTVTSAMHSERDSSTGTATEKSSVLDTDETVSTITDTGSGSVVSQVGVGQQHEWESE